MEEVVTYTPVNQANRDITVQIAGNRVSIEINEGGSEQVIERIGVHCLRNGTTGINTPRLGDTIVRYAASEPDERPYLYTGEIAWQSVDDWVLQFSRYRWTAHGDV